MVVGDIGQRHAIVGTDGLEGGVSRGSVPPGGLGTGSGSATVWMDLMYYPANRYERLQPGATFTIREGAKVVGYGKVLRRNDDGAI